MGATRVALRMGSSDWVDPQLVDPRLLVCPRGLVPGGEFQVGGQSAVSLVGWAPRGGYQGEGPTEVDTRKWAPRGGPQGLGHRVWAPGCGLQVGAAQGGLFLGERNGCGPHVGGPQEGWLQGWAQWGAVVWAQGGGYQGLGPQGDGNQGVAPEEGGGDTGVAPMALVPGGRQGVGLEDRGARVGPRLLEGSGVGRIQEWVGVAQWGGQKGEVEGVGHERPPGGGLQEGGPTEG